MNHTRHKRDNEKATFGVLQMVGSFVGERENQMKQDVLLGGGGGGGRDTRLICTQESQKKQYPKRRGCKVDAKCPYQFDGSGCSLRVETWHRGFTKATIELFLGPPNPPPLPNTRPKNVQRLLCPIETWATKVQPPRWHAG